MNNHRYNEKRLDRANCNGVIIELMQYWAKGEPEADAYFMIYIGDQYDPDGEVDDYDYETETEARLAFDGFVAEYKDKPNWNAQAAYDEAHGTINGEDAGIVAYRELVGEY